MQETYLLKILRKFLDITDSQASQASPVAMNLPDSILIPSLFLLNGQLREREIYSHPPPDCFCGSSMAVGSNYYTFLVPS